jgi:hypothetical protein
MADNITLRRRLAPAGSQPYNIALRGIASRATTVSAEIYWRDPNDPTSNWQLLGEGKTGTTLQVPFDPKGRTLEFSMIPKTAKGYRATNLIDDGVRTTFTVGVPALTDLTFSAPDVTGDIANNGGTGDISVLRKLSTDDAFSVIQTVSAATTSFTDTPPVNGDYEYKLTQAGLDGESNMLSVTVTGGGGGAGTPPDGLSGSYNSGTNSVDLSWTNHGGTGSEIVQAKIGSSGTWNQIDILATGTSSYSDPEDGSFSIVVIYYRVYNDAVTGYSNEVHVSIPREF